MKNIKVFLLVFSFLVLANTTLCQSYVGAYLLYGDAVDLGPNLYRLTSISPNVVGSLWYTKKIDLSKDFGIVANLNFGNDDNGADGIAFAFKSTCLNSISYGGGLGVMGLSPSFIVKFDTHQNIANGDLLDDHIAIIQNGNMDLASPDKLLGPICALGSCGNIETGQNYEIRILWKAADKTLQVYFDGSLRATYPGDIVNTIFGGNPFVYWGFAASTGTLVNEQKVEIVQTTLHHFVDLNDILLCDGDSAKIEVQGSNSAQWSPNISISNVSSEEPIVYPSSNRTYYLTYTDKCNFIIHDSVKVLVNPRPLVSLPDSFSVCLNSAPIALSIGTPLNGVYVGMGIQHGIFSPKVVGVGKEVVSYSYTDPITQCTGIDSGFIRVNPIPNSTILPSKLMLCVLDDSIILSSNVSNASSYSWFLNNNLISFSTNKNLVVNKIGKYYLQNTLTTGCTDTSNSVTIDYVVMPSKIDLSSSSLTLLPNSTLVADLQPGALYQWMRGDETFGVPSTSNVLSVEKAGIYSVWVTFPSGCKIHSSTLIIKKTVIKAKGDTTFCEGNKVELHAEKGFSTYRWVPGNADTDSIEVNSSGLYRVIVNEKDTSNSIYVEVNPLPTISITGKNTLCYGDSTLLYVNGALSYLWNTGSSASNYLVSPTKDSVFTVVGKDSNSCENGRSILIKVHPPLDTSYVESAKEATLTANEPDATYQWVKCLGNGHYQEYQKGIDRVFSIPENGSFALILSRNDCMDTSACRIALSNVLFQIPNAFSPNGDGLNEDWMIPGIVKYPFSKVKVFNRWGSLVYTASNGYNEPWNGKVQDNTVPIATYYYLIELRGSLDGTDHDVSGTVTVVK